MTVLDIRTDEDRAQWAIPGSLHLNAYVARGPTGKGCLSYNEAGDFPTGDPTELEAGANR